METKSGYLIKSMNNYYVVVADNIADACDKLESFGLKEYQFQKSRSLTVIESKVIE